MGVDVVQETVPEADARHAEALAICAACPALGACRAWVAESRPSQRPAGVVAGIPPPKRGGSRPTRKANQTTRKALP
nr:WhiB family transcriptional regulator [Mycolicibacter arupensis]